MDETCDSTCVKHCGVCQEATGQGDCCVVCGEWLLGYWTQEDVDKHWATAKSKAAEFAQYVD